MMALNYSYLIFEANGGHVRVSLRSCYLPIYNDSTIGRTVVCGSLSRFLDLQLKWVQTTCDYVGPCLPMQPPVGVAFLSCLNAVPAVSS